MLSLKNCMSKSLIPGVESIILFIALELIFGPILNMASYKSDGGFLNIVE